MDEAGNEIEASDQGVQVDDERLDPLSSRNIVRPRSPPDKDGEAEWMGSGDKHDDGNDSAAEGGRLIRPDLCVV